MSGPGKKAGNTKTGGGTPSPSGSFNWSAPISAGAGLLGDIWSNLAYKSREKSRRKYEKGREADRRQYDLEQWMRQNLYNHPTQQMQRLQDAGLNPNLIYGSSPGSAVGNAGAIPAGQAPKGQLAPFSIGNPAIPFMDAKVKQAQSNNLDSLSLLNDVKSATEVAKGRLTGTEADLAHGTLGYSMELKELEAKTAYQKFVQEELTTIAMSDKDKGTIARYAAKTMQAKIEKRTADYLSDVAALKAFMASKGILPDSFKWAQILAMIPSAIPGSPETLGEHPGFKVWKKEQNR